MEGILKKVTVKVGLKGKYASLIKHESQLPYKDWFEEYLIKELEVDPKVF